MSNTGRAKEIESEPRTRITYAVDEIDGPAERELPFVVGVLADLVGNGANRPEPFDRRRFVSIDRSNFNKVLSEITPRLSIRVKDLLNDGDGELDVELTFRSMEDFEPAGVIRQLPDLLQKVERRSALSDRMAISKLDACLSGQLRQIFHSPAFTRLEGTWRGLHYLVANTEASTQLQIRILNCSQQELTADALASRDFKQTTLHKRLNSEFTMPGGEPIAILIGDFEFTNCPDDIAVLRSVSQVAADACCPFVASAGPEMFSVKRFAELSALGDLRQRFLNDDYAPWQTFRRSEVARYLVLTLPRVLARPPYGVPALMAEEYRFQELEYDNVGRLMAPQDEHCCWMSAAYLLGSCLTRAFANHGWCSRIEGADGGLVSGLPSYAFPSDSGLHDWCSTEIGINLRDAELQLLGLTPLCHSENAKGNVFRRLQSAYLPKTYDRPEANSNARIAARLPYLMASSRFVHYMRVILRDKIGSFMERQDAEDWLRRWIADYICDDERPQEIFKTRFPLASAEVKVVPNSELRAIWDLTRIMPNSESDTALDTELSEETPHPDDDSGYGIVAWLRPWLPEEDLSASLLIVASVPMLND